MGALPEGTLTFMLTDVEGSTRAWEHAPAVMRKAIARHDQIVARSVQRHRGIDVHSGRAGDSTLTVFRSANAAAACALTIQRAFAREPWPADTTLRIRIALHSGEAELRQAQYYGQPLNRCARLLATSHGGQVLVTQATEELLVDDLPRGAALKDLGFHRLKDLARPEHVFELVDLQNPHEFPPIRSLRREVTNLPFQLTPFIGREVEVSQLRDALPDLRLLTLTGTAGAGKTRLAIQLAWEFVSQYPDGVWLIELGAVADHRQVAGQVAVTLGLREQPGRSLSETLREQLADRRTLLVFDSCEHVIGAVAQLIGDLLQHGERLTVVATSREPLHITGEVVRRVPPFGREESLRLFASRARLQNPAFEISDENVQLVARICERLDGLPLAIELAAARVSLIPMEDILSRLEARFSLLTTGDRAGTGRLKTLRAAIDWSYDLLAEDEQVLFRRVCSFADRFSLDGAEVLWESQLDDAGSVLGIIGSLVDKSMIVAEEGWYRCLETLRAYGRDRLRQNGEDVAIGAALARYVLGIAEHREAGQLGPWLDRLQDLHEDILATMEWSLDHDLDLGARLASALYIFWQLRGHASEPREFSDALLRRVSTDFAGRAALLHLSGGFAYLQSDLEMAKRRLEAAVAAARGSNDYVTAARALETLGLVRVATGDVTSAEAALEEALSLAQEQGQPESEAATLHQLGLVASRRGDNRRAQTLFERSIEIRRSLGRADEASMPMTFLAAVSLLQGDLETARRSVRESLEIGRSLRDRRAAWSLQMLAAVAAIDGQQELALRLGGAGAAMHEAAGTRPAATWEQFVATVLQPAREALGQEAATPLWEAGRRLTMDEAFDLALEAEAPNRITVGS